MKKEVMDMLLYHGSGDIVEYPAVRKTGYTKDFSWGFYCTNDLRQAERWAQKKQTPVVNIYEYTPVPSLQSLQFNEVCDAWLDFIMECRMGSVHGYDIVEGPMADDQIWVYFSEWERGDISREEFMMLAKFRHPTHQISFHTLRALDCLQFREAVQYDKK